MLNVLVIHNNSRISEQLNKMLAAIGDCHSRSITCPLDADLTQALTCDVIIMSDTYAQGPSAIEWLRWVTNEALVPAWCKVVVISDDSTSMRSDVVYRYLNTVVIASTLNEGEFKRTMALAKEGITSLKELIHELQRADHRKVLQAIVKVKSQPLSPKIITDLNLFLVRTLFVNGHQAQAFQIVEKISEPTLHGSAMLILSFSMGDDKAFYRVIEALTAQGILANKIRSYSALYAMKKRDFVTAAELFKSDSSTLGVKDKCAGILLLMKNQGMTAATALTELQLQTIDCPFSRRTIELNLFLCRVLTVLAHKSQGQILSQDKFAVAEFANFNTLAEDKFYAVHYLPFVDVLCNCVLQLTSRKHLLQQLTTLKQTIKPKDVHQSLLLAMAAAYLQQLPLTIELLVNVDVALAVIEPCQDVVAIEVIWQAIFECLPTTKSKADILVLMGKQLIKRRVYYRALTRFYQANCLADDDTKYLQILQTEMQKMGLTQYLDIELAQQPKPILQQKIS